MLDDYHLVDNHEVGAGRDLPAGAPAAPRARGAQHPRRPRPAAGSVAGARRAGRDPGRRPAFHLRRGRPPTSTRRRACDLAAADVAVLEERTEGWIAALQLAALSLQGRDDVSGFIARFAGDDRYIVDYLVEEVLRHQPDAVRDFLLQSAVLDRLTGPLCDAVTGRDDGSQMLVALERANLFIVALDDRREWYRYHHLFADVLRARHAQRAAGPGSAAAPARQPVVRAPRSDRGGGQARAGGPGLRPRGPPDGAGRAGDPTPPAGSDDARLAEGAARRRRPAQPGAQRLLRIHADGLRRPRRGRAPARRRGTRAGRRTRRARLSRGPTPTSCARCRPPSPSTGPRSPRPEATRPARRNTPGAPWTWPARTTISRAAGRPGSSASPPGPRATCRARWRRSRRRWPACTPPAASSTS